MTNQCVVIISTQIKGLYCVLISEICSHDEIVFDNESRFLAIENESLDNLSSDDSLFRIQVSRRLIDKINIGWLTKS